MSWLVSLIRQVAMIYCSIACLSSLRERNVETNGLFDLQCFLCKNFIGIALDNSLEFVIVPTTPCCHIPCSLHSFSFL